MKSISIKEVLKGSGHNTQTSRGNQIFEHVAASNGETIEILTTNDGVSRFLSSLRREDPGRFTIFKNIRDKAKKFGGKIVLQERNHELLVTLTDTGDKDPDFSSLTIA